MTEKQFKLEQITEGSLEYTYPTGSNYNIISIIIKKVEDDLNNLYEENQELRDRDILFNPQRHSKSVRLDFLERYDKLVGFENEVKEELESKYFKCDANGKELIKSIAKKLKIKLEDLE